MYRSHNSAKAPDSPHLAASTNIASESPVARESSKPVLFCPLEIVDFFAIIASSKTESWRLLRARLAKIRNPHYTQMEGPADVYCFSEASANEWNEAFAWMF
jgi:hypothetical protein